jgi:4a-hydroxytetrahydrobiopterin dehydratase
MTDSLAARRCRPCRKGSALLDAEATAALAREVPEWKLCDEGRRIERTYRFEDFASAFAYVERVAATAEDAKHHPDITFGWGYARLSLQTHTIGGLHENDFILAARCDAAMD